jgi:hypothetical protein
MANSSRPGEPSPLSSDFRADRHAARNALCDDADRTGKVPGGRVVSKCDAVQREAGCQTISRKPERPGVL